MKPHARSQHVVVIDLIRFVAAVLVLLTHLGFDVQTRPDSPAYRLSDGTMPNALLPELSFYGWIGVQVFFVISGIVITYSAHGASPYAFFRSRVLRLVPAAWLCSTLTLLILAWHHGAPTSEELRGYRHSMFFLPWAPWIDQAFWTLAIEISFYAAVGLLLHKKRLDSIITFATYLTWVCLAYWVLFILGETGLVTGPLSSIGKMPYWADRLVTLLLVKHGCFFAGGIYICAVLINYQRRPALAHIFAMLTACFLQIYGHTIYANGPMNYPYWPGAALWASSIAAILLGIQYNAILRSNATLVATFRLLGLMTYPFYLLHQNIGAIIIGKLRKFDIEPLMALCLSSLFIMILSWVVVTYAEPIIKRWMGSILDLGRSHLVRLRA